jgi:hypothetical protein
MVYKKSSINELLNYFYTDQVFRSIRDLWAYGFLCDLDALSLAKDIRDLELSFEVSNTPKSVIDEIDQFIFMLEGSEK